ncbi:MAG TPA: histidine phosphatase family protein [Luteibaculaceae bacterium]|nr:histidine phosphatase family protein [Luteibaculaceae bacterium]
MKIVYLIRHAKSDWTQANEKDFDRNLNHRGLRQIPVIASALKGDPDWCDQLYSSTAKRALLTANGINGLAPTRFEIQCSDHLYLPSVPTLLKWVNQTPDVLQSVGIICHNPGITDFAEYLCGAFIGNMPTCSVVKITFPANRWIEISKDTGQLKSFIYPAQFGI